MSTTDKIHEMAEEQEQMFQKHIAERERIEEDAPRYDVEYYIEAEDKRSAVMEAHGLLMDDLGEKNHVVITTNVGENSAPDGKYAVMIVVAGDVRKKTFESATATYLVDSGDKHHLWCLTDYEIPEEPVREFETSPYQSFLERVEMKFLR